MADLMGLVGLLDGVREDRGRSAISLTAIIRLLRIMRRAC